MNDNIICTLQYHCYHGDNRIRFVKSTSLEGHYYLEWRDYNGIFEWGAINELSSFLAELINDGIMSKEIDILWGDWNNIYNTVADIDYLF